MDIQFYGANCVRISSKQATIVVDDTMKSLGRKPITKKDDVALFTSRDADTAAIGTQKITINCPGEYEISAVSILGIPAQAHVDEAGKRATIFRLVVQGVRILVLGNIYPEITEAQLEQTGTIDILIIPVGGNGYTIDPIGAAKLVKKIDPKIIIPTHYDIPGIAYEVPQQPLSEALKALAMEPAETTAKFKLKPGATLPEAKQVIVLEPQL